MKNNIWLISILFLSLFVGCFEDESNYDLSTLDAPVWKQNDIVSFSFRAGETAKFRGTPYFTWNGDSVKRASEVTYEWKIGRTVVGNEADFDISTDDLIKKIGLMRLDGEVVSGSFSIIEKETGVTYSQVINVIINPSNAPGDWLVVSENGENTKLSFVKRLWTETGELTFELREDVYPDVNEGVIQGRPLLAAYADGATNIGSIGSLSIMTTSGRYEINCENMMRTGNLEEIPFTGKIGARQDFYERTGAFGLQTLVTDADGKLYRRTLSKNNLRGEFATTPMVLDAKGYNISTFGQVQRGFNTVPCYDVLNRRVVMISFYTSAEYVLELPFPGAPDFMGTLKPTGEEYKLSKLTSTQPTGDVSVVGCAKVWDMPVGTKVLYVWYVGVGGHPFMGGNYDIVGLIYKDAAGKTWLTEFAANQTTGMAMNGRDPFSGVLSNKNIEFPGGNLQEGTCFLTSSYTPFKREKYILYSVGDQIRFLNRSTNLSDNAFITLSDAGDKVNCMAWNKSYSELMVCTEKGNVIIYNCGSGDLVVNPKIVKQFNVGGRVVAAKELNNSPDRNDKY